MSIEDHFDGLAIPDDEDIGVALENDDEVFPPGKIELCLVGRFLTQRTINFNVMQIRMSEIWKPEDGVHVKSIANQRYLSQFFHEADVRMVVNGGLWTFDNNLLTLARFHQGLIPTNVSLVHIDIWARIYDLPAGFTSEKTGKVLGNYIGKFVQFDPKSISSSWMDYMRLRVRLDVRIPLKKGKKIILPDGSSSKVNFKYERLFSFCFLCGLLGHIEKFCPVERRRFGDSPAIPRAWGPELRAPVGRGAKEGNRRWLRDGFGTKVIERNLKGEAGEATAGVEKEAVGLTSDDPVLEKTNQGKISGIRNGKGKLALAHNMCMKMGIYNPLFDGLSKSTTANKGIVIGSSDERKRRRVSPVNEAQFSIVSVGVNNSPSPVQ